MLNNLFSSFDVKNFFFFSYLLVNIYMFFFFFMHLKLNIFFIFIKTFFSFMEKNISHFLLFKLTFFLIFFLNFISLNFYSFSLTSQISLNIFLIFSLWMPILVLNLTKFKNSFLIHLLPMSTSLFLIPMMILIELMSFFIRPLTLFLRLSINMIAGHVLVSLISSVILMQNMFFFFLMYIYMLMKFLVSFIQAYIVVTLLSLYIEEI
uniref:ATP synthase subunit a n=1 Tax=Tetranychus pueraricola TaxID=60960 RepID=A0A075XA64_TETPC|nr:ATP synthase F0 subunit 6 [Tetranychus pueraricola]AIH15695.1 ATP synthase F0 subunit 6 [Tetranychus pueraricola]AUT13861.1 ATP synthase F0 subunit 6 [Tetranychus pueraricola]AUT13874.1 ATP synthase F0 subunit 6 [Tetranychus pueraricola]AUT13887.1 ATP synthase F0 subunit 6 [Tetranychus pueraricola]AUT13900.1 ATP synthase F0 subunit 6 [Tetranychus pueraricola]